MQAPSNGPIPHCPKPTPHSLCRMVRADAAFGLAALGAQYRLDFVPLAVESFDLLIDRKFYFDPPMQKFLAFTATEVFAKKAGQLAGYDISEIGSVRHKLSLTVPVRTNTGLQGAGPRLDKARSSPVSQGSFPCPTSRWGRITAARRACSCRLRPAPPLRGSS